MNVYRVPTKRQALITVLLYSAHLQQTFPLFTQHICIEFLYVPGTELDIRFNHEPDSTPCRALMLD